MKVTKIALAILALAGIGSISSHAKNEPRTAYIFGFASSFNDSTVYFTDVQKVDSAYFTRKSKFLVSRENYSYQLRDYLTSHGVFTTIRASRGQDIFAACGLLSTAHKNKEQQKHTL